ncbi:hypothetical protein OH77DRAFT_699974 [Trametes cingulata]|nr:hypothetical protein OH77DRAFT_699974 [Trametes cingulata]
MHVYVLGAAVLNKGRLAFMHERSEPIAESHCPGGTIRVVPHERYYTNIAFLRTMRTPFKRVRRVLSRDVMHANVTARLSGYPEAFRRRSGLHPIPRPSFSFLWFSSLHAFSHGPPERGRPAKARRVPGVYLADLPPPSRTRGSYLGSASLPQARGQAVWVPHTGPFECSLPLLN